MDFVDIRVPFRAKAVFDKQTISFKDSQVTVHVHASSQEPLKPTLTRICGATLLGKSASTKAFNLTEGEKDGELRTILIEFKGNDLTEALEVTFEERRNQIKAHPDKGDAASRSLFETTPEEALYYSFITKADIQLEVHFEPSEKDREPARVILSLDYDVI